MDYFLGSTFSVWNVCEKEKLKVINRNLFSLFLAVDVCDTRKLNFNGNYNCSETGGVFSCMLTCPVGMTFQSTPAIVYSCDYAAGVFVPSSVPQCLFGK